MTDPVVRTRVRFKYPPCYTELGYLYCKECSGCTLQIDCRDRVAIRARVK